MNTRTMALIVGIVFLVVGAGGFFLIDRTAVPDAGLTMTHGFGHELGLFPVNTLHNIVHILFGLWGLLSYKSLGASKSYGKGVAIAYAVLTVAGFIPGLDTMFGLVPLFGNDIWLHALLALVAAYFGWMHRDVATGDRT